MNSSALKQQYVENSVSGVADSAVESTVVASETVVQMKTRQQLIAKQSEDACNLEGNKCGPDLDFFEEKYGICSFV